MLRYNNIYSLLLSLILLSGCFEIIEEITYTDGKQGNYLITINCSQSRDKLKALMKLDSFLGVQVPQQTTIYHYMNQSANALKATAGISQVKLKTNFHDFIFSIGFHFDSTEALNKGINAATGASTDKVEITKTRMYSLNNKLFQRLTSPGDSIAKAKASRTDLLDLIEGATATSIYRFTSEVESQTNQQAQLSKSKKAVMLKNKISDLLKNPELTVNQIQLK